MSSPQPISPEDHARFLADGYLVVPGFLPAATCDKLRARATELVEAFNPETVSVFSTKEQTRTSDEYFLGSGSDIRFFFEEEAFLPDGSLRQAKTASINKIGHALHSQDPAFIELSNSEAVLAILSSLGMAAPKQVQSMYIFKNPFIGGDVACHQDATFLYTEPVSVVGLWLALEDATQENGCMWALPGGHKDPLRKRFVRADVHSPAAGTKFIELDSTPLPEVFSPSQPLLRKDMARVPAPPGVTTGAPWVPLEAKKGTLILLHGLLPHWSCANRSPASRHAYAIHVIDAACHYPADNWLRL